MRARLAAQQAVYAVRQHHHECDQQNAEQNRHLRRLRPEQLRQDSQEYCSENRAARVIAAADDRHSHDRERDNRVERLLRLEIACAQCHYAADSARNEGCQPIRQHLVARHRHADRPRGLFILANGDQALAEPRQANAVRQRGRECAEQQGDPVQRLQARDVEHETAELAR